MLGERVPGMGSDYESCSRHCRGSGTAPVGLEAGERMAEAGREAQSCRPHLHPHSVPWFRGGSTQPPPQPLPLAWLLLAPLLPQEVLRLQQRPEKHGTKTTLTMET